MINENDRDWQFRMSLYYVEDQDTNTFTCRTPRGKTNIITVVVTGSYFVQRKWEVLRLTYQVARCEFKILWGDLMNLSDVCKV